MVIAQTATTRAANAVMVSVGGKAATVTYFETVSSSCFIIPLSSLFHHDKQVLALHGLAHLGCNL
jgi:hypothetical protein